MKSVRVLRHTTPVTKRLTLCVLNIQSANNKIDEILDVRREHALDVMLLSETWHDGDSVSIRRLRAEGLQVLERARPRASRITARQSRRRRHRSGTRRPPVWASACLP